VAAFGPSGLAAFLVLEPDLHGIVAVPLLIAHQQDWTGTDLQDGNRRDFAVRAVYLRHAYL
jgi:hypothetical protein